MPLQVRPDKVPVSPRARQNRRYSVLRLSLCMLARRRAPVPNCSLIWFVTASSRACSIRLPVATGR